MDGFLILSDLYRKRATGLPIPEGLMGMNLMGKDRIVEYLVDLHFRIIDWEEKPKNKKSDDNNPDYLALEKHKDVIEVMQSALKEKFGNPSSIHRYGREAKVLIENSRKTVAEILNVSPSEIFFLHISYRL